MQKKGFLSQPNDGTESNIDISPLIDVVFILLIFFMVSTTFVKDFKVDIDRPGASSSEMSTKKSMRILIDKNQNIFVDGQMVRSWTLQTKVKTFLAEGQGTSILVVTDKFVTSDKLIEVVDQCRLGGAIDIGVATNDEV